MKITVDTRGLQAEIARLRGMQKQVAYAASRALNATAKKVADAMPAELERDLDRPTSFTKRGVRVLRYASGARLEAIVGFMSAQAKYMQRQIDGGARTPGRGGLRLPTAVRVNEFGNIPRGAIAQLLAVAKKEMRANGKQAKLTRGQSRRIRVSGKVEIFYGDPKDQGGKQYPRGIYKRVQLSASKHQLIPLIVFPEKPAKYRPRFDFKGKAMAIVEREWPIQFSVAFDEAMRTAR